MRHYYTYFSIFWIIRYSLKHRTKISRCPKMKSRSPGAQASLATWPRLGRAATSPTATRTPGRRVTSCVLLL